MYIFNAGNGKLLMTHVNPDPKYEGDFGYSLALSGTRHIIAAPDDTVDGKVYAGSAYVFNATTGALISNLTDPHPQYDAALGITVAVSGTTSVVGAPLRTTMGQHTYSMLQQEDCCIPFIDL